MTTDTLTLAGIIEGAIETFREGYDPADFAQGEPHDAIHEVADGAVPVYNYDLLQLAADLSNGIALTEPEIGPAFDGTPTPINIIAANVYEAVEAALWEEWRRAQKERED